MNDDNSYGILSRVYPLLLEEKIIHPDEKEKVIKFEHPDVLLVKLYDDNYNQTHVVYMANTVVSNFEQIK